MYFGVYFSLLISVLKDLYVGKILKFPLNTSKGQHDATSIFKPTEIKYYDFYHLFSSSRIWIPLKLKRS